MKRFRCLMHSTPQEDCIDCELVRLGPPICEEWNERERIYAIKKYRQRTGAGLRAAAEAFKRYSPHEVAHE